jgi:hypothetical protein
MNTRPNGMYSVLNDEPSPRGHCEGAMLDHGPVGLKHGGKNVIRLPTLPTDTVVF